MKHTSASISNDTPRADTSSENVQKMFNTLAPRYDFRNALLSFGLAARLRRTAVRMAQIPAGGKLLDLCTGTADTAIAARKLHDDVSIAGCDFAHAMLAQGAKKVEKLAISLAQGDCLALPFRDGLFDAVTITWGLRNLHDLDAGLAEAARVLKPGGRLVVLDFSRPDKRLNGWLFDRLFPVHARMIGGECSQAYSGYLPASIAAFPAPDKLAEAAANHGLNMEALRRRAFGCIFLLAAVKTDEVPQ